MKVSFSIKIRPHLRNIHQNRRVKEKYHQTIGPGVIKTNERKMAGNYARK